MLGAIFIVLGVLLIVGAILVSGALRRGLEPPAPAGPRLLLRTHGVTSPAGTYQIDGRGATIGRDPAQVDLVLPDALVSRRHLRIELTPQGFRARNLAPNNFFVVNGERVQEGAALRDGDLLRLGTTDLEVQVVDLPEPTP